MFTYHWALVFAEWHTEDSNPATRRPAIEQISPIRTSKSICSSAPGNKISKASPDSCNWLFVRFSGKTSLRRGTYHFANQSTEAVKPN